MTQAERILKAFRRRRSKTLTMVELNAIAYRYSARLWDLKHDGYEITKKRLKNGIWVYTLVEN